MMGACCPCTGLLVDGMPCILVVHRELCKHLELKGRIRVAPDGINVTVGGSMASLHGHIEEVKVKNATSM